MSKHLPPKKNKHERAPGKSVLNTPLREPKNAHSRNELVELEKKNVVFVAASALVLLLGFVLPFEGWLPMALFAVALLLSGFQVILRAADEVMRLQLLEADILMLVSSIAAFATGSYAGAASLMLSYRLIKLLEGWAEKKTQELTESFHAFLPQKATLVTEHGTDEIEPERIAEDDILAVEPGEIFPVDGYVVEGVSAMDASPITGSANNRAIGAGSMVYSGCINVSGAVKIKAERIYAESAACLISQLLDKAGRFKPRAEKFALQIERYLTPTAVLLAFVTAVFLPIFNGGWADWIGRGAAILALSGCSFLPTAIANCCSCAMVWCVRRGIIFKGSCFFESLGTAQTFIFNKTSTLTEGKYVVTEIVPEGMSKNEFLAMAANVESVSDHPIARAICWAYGSDAGKGLKITAEEIEGRGLVASVNNTDVIVGNAVLLGEHGIDCPVTPKGTTAIHMAINDEYAGYILLEDKIRENAFDQLEALRYHGVKNLVTLTSDLRSVARPLASSLNMDMVRAELSAEGKVSAVEYLMATKAEHSTLAFVCDGAGDPETLSRADVGISFGALGHNEAYKRADVLIAESRLSALAEAVGISSQVCRTELVVLLAFCVVKLLSALLVFTGMIGLTAVCIIELALNVFTQLISLNITNYDNNRRNRR